MSKETETLIKLLRVNGHLRESMLYRHLNDPDVEKALLTVFGRYGLGAAAGCLDVLCSSSTDHLAA